MTEPAGLGEPAVPRSAEPWYVGFFGEAFWTVATHEYTAERTEREADYLAAVLTDAAPGRRVVDLGCGTGRHAMALARRGFDAVGADVNTWAVEGGAELGRLARIPMGRVLVAMFREPP